MTHPTVPYPTPPCMTHPTPPHPYMTHPILPLHDPPHTTPPHSTPTWPTPPHPYMTCPTLPHPTSYDPPHHTLPHPTQYDPPTHLLQDLLLDFFPFLLSWRGGCIMKGWGGWVCHEGVGWVMKRLGASWRGGLGCAKFHELHETATGLHIYQKELTIPPAFQKVWHSSSALMFLDPYFVVTFYFCTD